MQRLMMMLAAAALVTMTLTLPGTPVGAGDRGCTAQDIKMVVRNAAGAPDMIPEAGGDFKYGLRFSLHKAECRHPPMLPNDMGIPQPIDVPFCFEIFDTTECDGTPRTDGSTCTAGQPVGSNIPVRVSVGPFTRHGNEICLAIPKVRNDNNVTILATPNAIKDRPPHRIIAMMSNPFRFAFFDIADDD